MGAQKKKKSIEETDKLLVEMKHEEGQRVSVGLGQLRDGPKYGG